MGKFLQITHPISLGAALPGILLVLRHLGIILGRHLRDLAEIHFRVQGSVLLFHALLEQQIRGLIPTGRIFVPLFHGPLALIAGNGDVGSFIGRGHVNLV